MQSFNKGGHQFLVPSNEQEWAKSPLSDENLQFLVDGKFDEELPDYTKQKVQEARDGKAPEKSKEPESKKGSKLGMEQETDSLGAKVDKKSDQRYAR